MVDADCSEAFCLPSSLVVQILPVASFKVGAFDIKVEVEVRTPKMFEGEKK